MDYFTHLDNTFICVHFILTFLLLGGLLVFLEGLFI